MFLFLKFFAIVLNMKIAIISDTHDNLANIKKIVDWLNKPPQPNSPTGEWCGGREKINLLLHCGDISTQETLEEIVKNFKGEVKFVRGNADFGLADLPETGEIEIDDRTIALTHFFDKAKELAESEKYNIVFYGHTHRPWEEKIGGCRLVNPGEAAGQYQKATFAVYDTKSDKLELKILEKLE